MTVARKATPFNYFRQCLRWSGGRDFGSLFGRIESDSVSYVAASPATWGLHMRATGSAPYEAAITYGAGQKPQAIGSVFSDTFGGLRIESGYVRPEDELVVEPQVDPVRDDAMAMTTGGNPDTFVVANEDAAPRAEPEEDEGLAPISDRLMAELTSHRTLALRQALGDRPEIAFVAALHAPTLKSFYHYGLDKRIHRS